jgi:hypothetical protein
MKTVPLVGTLPVLQFAGTFQLLVPTTLQMLVWAEEGEAAASEARIRIRENDFMGVGFFRL